MGNLQDSGQVMLSASEYAAKASEEAFNRIKTMFYDGRVILLPLSGGDAIEVIRCVVEEAFQEGAEAVLAAAEAQRAG